MQNLKKIFQLLSNIQISSALIWASTILACSYFSDKATITMILITAAGFHSVLMAGIEDHQAACRLVQKKND